MAAHGRAAYSAARILQHALRDNARRAPSNPLPSMWATGRFETIQNGPFGIAGASGNEPQAHEPTAESISRTSRPFTRLRSAPERRVPSFKRKDARLR
jgi:hypothetical protein